MHPLLLPDMAEHLVAQRERQLSWRRPGRRRSRGVPAWRVVAGVALERLGRWIVARGRAIARRPAAEAAGSAC
jgi:hypothetical protein